MNIMENLQTLTTEYLEQMLLERSEQIEQMQDELDQIVGELDSRVAP